MVWMGEIRNAYRVLIGKNIREREETRRLLEGRTKVDLKGNYARTWTRLD
jgi:hypothetical protein